MARKHYHVITGMGGGYSPNDSVPFTTKRAAQDYARETARRWQEDQEPGGLEPDEIRKMSGSARAGFYSFVSSSPHDLGEYIEVTECDSLECYCVGCGELLEYEQFSRCYDCGHTDE